MRAFILMCSAVLSMAGCAGSPKSKFYTLSAVGPVQSAPAASAVPIAIESVTVPELVDRPQMVVRVDATRVEIDEFSRWAEPLKSQIPAVIAEDLTRLVPGARVSVYPQRADDGAVYRVSVDVQRFESAPGTMAGIAVLWSVRPPTGTAVSGRTVVHEPVAGGGYDALVDAHNRAIGAVSADIARSIQQAQH
jgi:uncharacterized lipoprotein YmbA